MHKSEEDIKLIIERQNIKKGGVIANGSSAAFQYWVVQSKVDG